MSTKKTPGPWHFVGREEMEDGSIYPAHIIGGVTQLQVCLMESPAVAEAIVNDPAWHALANSEMRYANGRLIAAAPDMLEALIDALALIELVMPIEGEVTRKVRKAIAKAEGTEP